MPIVKGAAADAALTAAQLERIAAGSHFSGARFGISTLPANNRFDLAYTDAMLKSGRFISGNEIQMIQPAFDTYSSCYEKDGFKQQKRTGGQGHVWTSLTTGIDEGADGIDNNGVDGADDFSERETSAPFTARPEAIRITVRQENPATRQLQQMSVIHRDNR